MNARDRKAIQDQLKEKALDPQTKHVKLLSERYLYMALCADGDIITQSTLGYLENVSCEKAMEILADDRKLICDRLQALQDKLIAISEFEQEAGIL